MATKMGRYISVFMLLAVFLTANGLQYTHDIAHHHTDHYGCSSVDHTDHKHPETDECALCWFVLHQMSSSFVFVLLLPEVAVQERVSLLNELYSLSCQDGIPCLLGNKDPPLGV